MKKLLSVILVLCIVFLPCIAASAQGETLALDAKSAVLMDVNTGKVLYALKENASTAASFQRIGGELNMHPIRIDEWDKKMTSITGLAGDNLASSQAEDVTNKIAIAADPYYADEIPPFDITISFANEYGQKAFIVIYGVEILNEGTGYSIDSIISEKACTFVARRVQSMQPVED